METKTEIKVQKYYLLTDYIHWRGGMWNVQRSRIVPVGQAWGFIKCFTSEIDKAEQRAKSWAKKHNIVFV
ncbi:MAG TPA: hypothetical protein VIH28_07155 [Ignavibacteriaceae bacterium]